MKKKIIYTIPILYFVSYTLSGQNEKFNSQVKHSLNTPTVITVDYNDRFLSDTKFGSNTDINDHKQVGERLFDERITDRGFEWTKDPNWSFTLNGGLATFTQDSLEKYAGKYSLKSVITSTSAAGPAIIFPGIWVEAGSTYNFSFWAKGPYSGGVIINLLDPQNFNSLLPSTLNYVSFDGNWTKFSGTLTINKSQVNALLTIIYQGTGTLFLDQLSITPTSSTSYHISPILSNAIKDLGLKVMRFPTESNIYEWKNSIGPREQRNVSKPLISYYKANSSLGYEKQPLYNDFGLDEFLQLADTFGWSPVMRVNVMAGSATAANLVEYCNGPITTIFGAQRAANGHAAPYMVKYWEIGNELWNQISPEPGAIYNSSGFTQANTDNYKDSLIAFSIAMKKVDPAIKIGAIGGQKPSDSYLTNIVDPDWNDDLLAGAALYFDFFGNHYYAPGSDPRSPAGDSVYNALMGESLFFERELIKLKMSIASSSNPSIKIGITEYAISPANIIDPKNDGRNLQSLLWLASMKNAFLRQKVELAAQFDFLNESGSLLLHKADTTNNTNKETIVISGPAILEILYKEYLKNYVIPASLSCNSFSSYAFGWMPSESAIPILDAIASTDESKGILTLFIINRDKNADITADLNLLLFPGTLKFDTGVVIQGFDVTSINTISNPNIIYRSPVLSTDVVSNASYFTTTFKKASITCLQFYYSPALLKEYVNEKNFMLYPNPCHNSFRLSINDLIPGTVNVSMVNLFGEMILNHHEVNNGKQFSKEFDLKKTPSGVYFVRIQNYNKIYSRKIIVYD